MNTERKRGGRIPRLNPKSHHVMFRFDDDEWMKFLVMYEQTDVKAKAVFAKARIFGEPFKVLREDKTLVEYYTKLSSFHSQYRLATTTTRLSRNSVVISQRKRRWLCSISWRTAPGNWSLLPVRLLN